MGAPSPTAMAQFDLRVRNLATGDMLIASFESEEDVADYLVHRPEMMEVIGLKTDVEDPEIHSRLKQVVRPFDGEELARVAMLDAQDALARAQQQAAEAKRAKAEADAHREKMKTADPNRIMKITWSRTGGFVMLDPADEREITEAARDAIIAWVNERNEWVESRGLEVEEAVVEVWPGPLPAGGSRVLQGGRFTPTAKASVGDA